MKLKYVLSLFIISVSFFLVNTAPPCLYEFKQQLSEYVAHAYDLEKSEIIDSCCEFEKILISYQYCYTYNEVSDIEHLDIIKQIQSVKEVLEVEVYKFSPNTLKLHPYWQNIMQLLNKIINKEHLKS